jgi:ATP-dependent helicase/nuclease subunit A
MNDEKDRQDAILLEENLAVTAGAGTGKTTLLIDRVLAQLLVRGRDLRRILMMTFTEKAAGEMRERLEKRLRELADREKWIGRGAEHLEERRLEALARLDRAEIGTIHSFCAHVLREYPIEAGLDPGFQVDQGDRFDDLFRREWPRWLDTELGKAPPRKDAWKRVLGKISLVEMEAVARALCSFRIPPDAARSMEFFERMAGPLADRCAALAAKGPAGNNLTAQLRGLSLMLRTGRGDFADDPSKAQKGWGALFDEAHAAAREALPLARARRDSDEALLETSLGLLRDFAARFRQTFTREGWVSFDGLLLLVRTLLADPGVRADLQARYDFILVDEFQDTDPVQGEIVLGLCEENGRIRRGKLFIVGDPKQSIYAFRGADIVSYEDLKQRILSEGGREIFLRSNFRSRETIVNAVNAIFPRIIVRNGPLQPDYVPIDPTEPPGPEVELALFEEAKAGEVREAEAAAIANRIRESGFRPGDVAILLKALTDVPILVEALRARDIRYVVEGEKFFYVTQEVIDAVNLLGSVANPGDRIALAGVLRSPVGALDDRTIYEMRGSLDYRKPPPDGLEDLWAMLREARERSATTGLSDLLDWLYDRAFLLETAAAGWHGEQAVANLLKLRQSAREFEASTGGTLGAFLQRVRAAMRELEEEGESPLADEKLDAVKILSIHKSKGLEFPVVFLPDLHRQTRGGGDPPAVRFDWKSRALGLRFAEVGDPVEAALARDEELRRREEVRRLLYVAMTRAKERLILSGSADFRPDSFLGILSFAGAFDVLKPSRRSVASSAPPPVRPVAPSPARADWAAFHADWVRREMDVPLPRFTSVTRLEEKAPSRGFSRGAEIGIACHAALERMDFARPAIDTPDAEARAILESFLATPAFRELADSEFLARELPFLLPHGDQILEGYIDVVYRRGGRVWVADYKTDAAVEPAKYALARDVYVRAVRDALGLEVAGFKLIYLRHGRVVES